MAGQRNECSISIGNGIGAVAGIDHRPGIGIGKRISICIGIASSWSGSRLGFELPLG